MTDKPTWVLRSTLTSPFGRKVRMAAAVLGLTDRYRLVPADTLDETDTLRQQNPLGKLPCLLLEDARRSMTAASSSNSCRTKPAPTG